MHLVLSLQPPWAVLRLLIWTYLASWSRSGSAVSTQRQEGEIVAAIQESSHIRQTLDLKEIQGTPLSSHNSIIITVTYNSTSASSQVCSALVQQSWSYTPLKLWGVTLHVSTILLEKCSRILLCFGPHLLNYMLHPQNGSLYHIRILSEKQQEALLTMCYYTKICESLTQASLQLHH